MNCRWSPGQLYVDNLVALIRVCSINQKIRTLIIPLVPHPMARPISLCIMISTIRHPYCLYQVRADWSRAGDSVGVLAQHGGCLCRRGNRNCVRVREVGGGRPDWLHQLLL